MNTLAAGMPAPFAGLAPSWCGAGWQTGAAPLEGNGQAANWAGWLHAPIPERWNAWARPVLTHGGLAASQQPSVLQAYLWPRSRPEVVAALPWQAPQWDAALWLLGLAEAARCGPASAFELGARLLPGPCGVASQLLMAAPDGLAALQLLCLASSRLSPLMTPRLLLGPQQAWLWWMPACALPHAQRAWLTDLHHAAVLGLVRLLQGPALGCEAHFARTPPRDLAPHWSHLGPSLNFHCQADALAFPRSQLEREGVDAGRRATWLSREAWPMLAMSDAGALERPLIARLQDWLFVHLDQSPSQEEAASALGLSVASLKRHLQAQGTHYQAEWDSVRALACAFLLQQPGWAPARVQALLGITDASHFRRSVRRWTGLLPSALRPAG